jgi:hypothetical protein
LKQIAEECFQIIDKCLENESEGEESFLLRNTKLAFLSLSQEDFQSWNSQYIGFKLFSSLIHKLTPEDFVKKTQKLPSLT